MSGFRSRRAGARTLFGSVLAAGLAALVLAVPADAGLVKADGIVLHVDGGFSPHVLPRHGFAPIQFQGSFKVARQGGGQPPALQQLVLEFDRDGRFGMAGLPVCQPGRIAEMGTAAARAACKGAIVGSGRLQVAMELGWLAASEQAPLTVFNGPRTNGLPTAVVHTQLPPPVPQTLVMVVPIEKRHGAFGYRATLEIPQIAGGLGSLTALEVKIGRRYRWHGRSRSYLSARCGEGSLRTHGRFSFEGGLVVEGQAEQACSAK